MWLRATARVRIQGARVRRAIYQEQIAERSNELLQVFYVGVPRGRKNLMKVMRGWVINLRACYVSWNSATPMSRRVRRVCR